MSSPVTLLSCPFLFVPLYNSRKWLAFTFCWGIRGTSNVAVALLHYTFRALIIMSRSPHPPLLALI